MNKKTSALEAARIFFISLLVTMRVMLTCLCFLATILATSHGQDLDHGSTYQIYPLRLKPGSGGYHIPGISCKSWRLAVETHNIIDWTTIPEECEGYVGNYMLGDQYKEDSKVVALEAFAFARNLNLSGGVKDI